MLFSTIDAWLIGFDRKHVQIWARWALFIIFFWFGILKVLGVSPAADLVAALLQVTMPGAPFEGFMIFFGFVEMLIGTLFLIKGQTRLAILLLLLHMVTTVLPLILLPSIAWAGWLTPTLEGQYIIKNVALVALAVALGAYLEPLKPQKKSKRK